MSGLWEIGKNHVLFFPSNGAAANPILLRSSTVPSMMSNRELAERTLSKAPDGKFKPQNTSNRQLMQLQSGDGNYPDQYLRHILNIPQSFWRNAKYLKSYIDQQNNRRWLDQNVMRHVRIRPYEVSWYQPGLFGIGKHVQIDPNENVRYMQDQKPVTVLDRSSISPIPWFYDPSSNIGH